MTSTLLLSLWLAASASPSTDAGRADAGTSVLRDAGPGDVPAWRLSQKLSADGGLRAALIADFTAKGGGPGEVALTRERAEAILNDPRTELVYGEKTVAIVSPSMVSRHRQEHLDLMALFLKPERIAAGEAFAKEHEAVLAQVEQSTGVHREVVIAILTWESKLGTITGDYLAFNVFTSQAFFIDEANEVALKRAGEKAKLSRESQAARVEKIRNRARANLVALVRQCESKNIDALAVKGSWAGALGFPQFMPASLRWAADGDGDGDIDLFTFPDAIASIGKYLKAHGYAESREKAVYGYNHENAYVQGVLTFAQVLSAKLGRDAGTFYVGPAAGPSDAGVK